MTEGGEQREGRTRWVIFTNFLGDTPVLDLLVAAAIAVAYGAAKVRPHADLLSTLGDDARTVFYQTSAGVSAGLFAVSFTVVAIFTALSPGDRLRTVTATFPTFLSGTFRSVLRAYAIATGITVLAGATDQAGDLRQWTRGLVVFALTLSVLRTWRLLWMFTAMLGLILKDQTASPVSAAWMSPPADLTSQAPAPMAEMPGTAGLRRRSGQTRPLAPRK